MDRLTLIILPDLTNVNNLAAQSKLCRHSWCSYWLHFRWLICLSYHKYTLCLRCFHLKAQVKLLYCDLIHYFKNWVLTVRGVGLLGPCIATYSGLLSLN
jgi:hypothetical protein